MSKRTIFMSNFLKAIAVLVILAVPALSTTASAPESSIGLYDQSDGVFHLKGEAPFRFGPRNSTWLPVTGKWKDESDNGDPDVNTAQIEEQVFNMVNQERTSQGLPALQRDSLLDEVARAHSKDMGDNNYDF